MLPSASLGEKGPGLFEPIHGSAPDIAGQDKANPLATVLSTAMLLKYGLGEKNAAERIEAAVLDTLNRGFRTGDINSEGNTLLGCRQMGEEVLRSVESEVPVTIEVGERPPYEDQKIVTRERVAALKDQLDIIGGSTWLLEIGRLYQNSLPFCRNVGIIQITGIHPFTVFINL